MPVENDPNVAPRPSPKPPLWRRVVRELIWIGLFAGVYFALQSDRAPKLATGSAAPAIVAE